MNFAWKWSLLIELGGSNSGGGEEQEGGGGGSTTDVALLTDSFNAAAVVPPIEGGDDDDEVEEEEGELFRVAEGDEVPDGNIGGFEAAAEDRGLTNAPLTGLECTTTGHFDEKTFTNESGVDRRLEFI